jgi:hypothetical protein
MCTYSFMELICRGTRIILKFAIFLMGKCIKICYTIFLCFTTCIEIFWLVANKVENADRATNKTLSWYKLSSSILKLSFAQSMPGLKKITCWTCSSIKSRLAMKLPL